MGQPCWNGKAQKTVYTIIGAEEGYYVQRAQSVLSSFLYYLEQMLQVRSAPVTIHTQASHTYANCYKDTFIVLQYTSRAHASSRP